MAQASRKTGKKITTTCSYDCGGRCLLEVDVRDGRVIDIRSGSPEGLSIKACPRGLIQKEVLYSPDRLKAPLKRTGERGSGEFEPVTWGEALDIVSRKLIEVIERFGTGSIFFLPGSGCQSSLNHVGTAAEIFFGSLGGCTTVWGGESLEAALQSSLATFGTRYAGSTRDDILNSKYIILWGWNPRDTRFGSDTYHYLKEARDSGTRSDLEIFAATAAGMGLGDLDAEGTRRSLEQQMENIDTGGIAALKDKGIYKYSTTVPRIAFSEEIKDPDNKPFPTPSGKIEIFSSRFHKMADPMLPPVPRYIPAWEGHQDKKAGDYPIQLITTHARLRINSQLDNIGKLDSSREDRIWINTLDARKRHIADDDMVLVYNDRGKIRVRASVTPDIMKGVASIDQGKWYMMPDEDGIDNGNNANVLTLDRMSPAGAFASNSCLVQIKKQ